MPNVPPVTTADPSELQKQVMMAAQMSAMTVADSLRLARQVAAGTTPDLDQAGSLAATAAQAAASARDLCSALMVLQGAAPVKAIGGTAPNIYA
jgi:hypothetical protein